MNLHTIREITYGTIFFRLFLSIVIGGVLGLERGRKSRPAGLRTYILVCLGSTVVMMTNQYVSQCMNTGDPVRMGAQVLSGIGFIGAGSIMKTGRNQVRGITTAAGLWAAACIGLAIGIGFYEVAIAGGILIFIVLSLMQNIRDLIFRLMKTTQLRIMRFGLSKRKAQSFWIVFLMVCSLEKVFINGKIRRRFH